DRRLLTAVQAEPQRAALEDQRVMVGQRREEGGVQAIAEGDEALGRDGEAREAALDERPLVLERASRDGAQAAALGARVVNGERHVQDGSSVGAVDGELPAEGAEARLAHANGARRLLELLDDVVERLVGDDLAHGAAVEASGMARDEV